jgi:CheY-like chemotaxis protein
MTLGDDPLVLELLDSVTSQAGYRLVRATDGAKAVALAQAEPPRVIIADMLSPGVDVFDVVDRVRADPRTATIPIVVLTTEAMTSGSKKRLNDQIVRVAQKSELDRDILLALVASLAESTEPMGGAWRAS